jgi:hypothetical protein
MTNWEAIFTQSPVSQGYYNEQRLPSNTGLGRAVPGFSRAWILFAIMPAAAP